MKPSSESPNRLVKVPFTEQQLELVSRAARESQLSAEEVVAQAVRLSIEEGLLAAAHHPAGRKRGKGKG